MPREGCCLRTEILPRIDVIMFVFGSCNPSIRLLLAVCAGVLLVSACTPPIRPESELQARERFERRPELQLTIDAQHLDGPLASGAIFHETNRVRVSLGLPPFTHLDGLDRAADLQASANALAQTAVHHNLLQTLATPYDRVLRVGLKPQAVAENAAFISLLNFDPDHGVQQEVREGRRVDLDAHTGQVVTPHTYGSLAVAVVDAWMKSPGHRANIVSMQFECLGCAVRPATTISGLDMVACMQVFFSPIAKAP
jgi:hypothetical protein